MHGDRVENGRMTSRVSRERARACVCMCGRDTTDVWPRERSESLQRDRSTGYQVPNGTFATFIVEASKQFSSVRHSRCSAVAWNEQKLAVMRTYRDRFVEETRSLSRLGRKTRTNRPIKANETNRVFDPCVDTTYVYRHAWLLEKSIYIYIFNDFYFVQVDPFFLFERGTLSIR